jgi:hypothetical protein
MAHGTPGLTPRERFRARLRHYLAYTVLFVLVYGAVRLLLGSFPVPLLLGILLVSLGKDVVDELRLRRGGKPVGYAGIEHAPSNAVLLLFVLSGFVTPAGAVGPVSVRTLVLVLAAVDLVFDLSQDARA